MAQNCPSVPVIVNGTPCTVASPAITVPSNGAPGLTANGAGGNITADNITINLGPGGTVGNRNYIGAQANSGGYISIDNTTIHSQTPIGPGQRGIISNGANSLIEGINSEITIGLGATAASDMVAVLAQAGGAVTLTNGTVTTLGGASGIGNYAVWATGTDSQITANGSTISTVGRSSHAAYATAGGVVTVSSGSSISVSGLLSSAARAEGGGSVTLVGTTVTSSSGASADTDPSSALRALTGSTVSISGGSTVTATGVRGHGGSAEGAGAELYVTDTTVTVSGSRANAIYLTDRGYASITDSALSSANAVGIVLQNGSTLEMTGGSLETTAATAVGINVTTNSTATLDGTSITTNGLNAVAIQAISGGVVNGTDISVVTNGNGRPYGAYAGVDGSVILNGGTVDTFGDTTDPSTSNARRPEALVAQGANALLQATDTVAHTRGIEAFAVVADDGGTVELEDVTVVTDGVLGIGLYAITDRSDVGNNTIDMTGGSVETFGLRGHGAQAAASNLDPLATINLDDVEVTTHGSAARGLAAILKGTVNADNSTVLTEGADAYGIFARDNDSSVNLENTLVRSSGVAAHGAVAERGGLVTGDGAAVIAVGSNAAALYVAGEPGFVSKAVFNGTQAVDGQQVGLLNVSGPTVGVAGLGDVTLSNTDVRGSGQWLLVGTIDDFAPLAAPELAHVHLTDEEIGEEPPQALPPPPALTATAGLANIIVENSTLSGSAITMAGSVSNVTMRSDTFWDLTGNSNLTYLLNASSLIDFSPPTGDPLDLASYKTLTVNNYVGDAGLIALNTYLGTDGAPSDLLIIDNGTATGTTGLIIDNTTGPGALTTANGILVVEAINGATTPTAFSLADEVVAGPYEYFLYYGSVDETGPENWYLRSTLDCSLVDPPVDPCPDPDPEPNYRQEVPLAEALPALMDFYGRNLIDTLHERVGENAPPHPGTVPVEPADVTPFWGRVMGNVGRHQGDAIGVYGDGPTFDYGMGAIQGGIDLHHAENADGDIDRAGVFGAIGTAIADVTHNRHLLDEIAAGESRLGAYSLGGYWTHYEDDGAYIDAVVMGTFYTLGIDSGRREAASTQGWGVAASLEAGRAYDLGGDWLIEPQVQLIGQWFDIDDFSDGAADIGYSNLGSLVGRMGFRLAHDFTLEMQGDDMPASAWLRGNLWHQFVGQPTVAFSSEDGPVPFTADLRDTWLEVGVGSDLTINATQAFYTALNMQTNIEGTSVGASGRVGLKGVW